MKTIRDPKQLRLVDPFQGVISETGRKLLSNGWQGVMRHVLLHQLPALRLGDDLSDDLGRPSTELYSICGLLLIREFQNWTVPQTLEAVLFRSDVQYALNLEPGFEISQRTIERYLARLVDDEGLSGEIMATITDVLVKELDIQISKQRLDSTHIFSDMAVFGRTRSMGVAIKRFLAEVKRRFLADYESLAAELRERYEVSVGSLFSDAKTSEQRQKTRQRAAEDLHAVIEHFANHEVIASWSSYRKLVSMFGQQCEVSDERVEVKLNPGGNIIVNPSDPDATFSGCKGAGYQAQLSETCDTNNEVQLIVGAQVETACTADANALEPMLDDLESRGLKPEQLNADSSYGSDDNCRLAEQRQVELISPVPGGKKFDEQQITAANFTVDSNNHKVMSCPAGHQPLHSHYNDKADRFTVVMSAEVCMNCPLREACLVQIKKSQRDQRLRAKVYFKMHEHRSASRRAAQQKSEFRERYQIRAGIESTHSGLKRCCGLKRLRVRGMAAVKASVLLKIAGWNILRAACSSKLRAKMWKIVTESLHKPVDARENPLLNAFKRQLALPAAQLTHQSRDFQPLTHSIQSHFAAAIGI